MKKNLPIIAVCLAFLGYVGLFFLPKLPTANFFGLLGVETIALVFTCGWLLLTAKSNKTTWRIILFVLILATFTLPLLRLWQNASSNYYLVLGILPWSDANGYFSDANRLLDGSLLGPFSGNRPLFPALLATLLALSGRDLQLVVIMLAVITASAVFICATWASDKLHPIAGLAVVLFSWFYALQIVGTTMTEQLGFPLGTLALVALLRGVQIKNRWWFAGGLCGLTFALLARAGAFFVLPFLLIYGVFYFRQQDKAALKISLLLLSALLIPVFLNFIIGRLVAEPETVQMSNFAYTFYGQAIGGKGWEQVFVDHPELSHLGAVERNQAIFRFALEIIRDNPGLFLQGIAKAYGDYFGLSQFSAFGFLSYADPKIASIYQALPTFLMVMGVLISLIKAREPLYGLTVAGYLGILCSLPFLPPAEAAWMRIQAATMMWEFWLVGIAAAWIFTRFIPDTVNLAFDSFTCRFTQILGIGLLSLTLLGAGILRLAAPEPRALTGVCTAEQVAIQFPVYRHAFVTIRDDQTGRFPEIDLGTFKRGLAGFPGVYWEFTRLIDNLEPPATLLLSVDTTGNALWIVGPSTLGEAQGQVVFACVEKNGAQSAVIRIETFKISQ